MSEAYLRNLRRLGRLPAAVEWSVRPEELLDVFASYRPQKRARFLEIIDAAIGDKENTFREIEAGQDVEILKPLCALSLVENDKCGFWKWRLHVRESPAFRRYLTAA